MTRVAQYLVGLVSGFCADFFGLRRRVMHDSALPTPPRLWALTDLNGSLNHKNLIVLQCLPGTSGFAQAPAPSSVSLHFSDFRLSGAWGSCGSMQSVCHGLRGRAPVLRTGCQSSRAHCRASSPNSICASPTRSLNDPSFGRISISSAPTSSSLDTQEGG